MLREKKVTLRRLKPEDIPLLWEFIYGQAEPEWKKWDAPYFPIGTMTRKDFEKQKKKETKDPNPDRMYIEVEQQLIGMVTYYWEHQPSNWLEVGIVIYQPSNWHKGAGTEALKLWIQYLFDKYKLIRIGLTTWSGNTRMIRVAEKTGMREEGRIRKCRYYKGSYYDSIKMGMLREEWLSGSLKKV
jgi:RimJ/RimL family protein N-acetyltransferase